MTRLRKASTAFALTILAAGCAANTETRVSEELFELRLPGAWSAIPSGAPDYYVYQSQANEHLFVAFHRTARSLSPAEQTALARELADLRRPSTLGQAASTVEVSSVSFSDSLPTAQFTIHDAARARRAATLVWGTSSGLFVFHLETLDKTAAEFEHRSEAILSSVVIK